MGKKSVVDKESKDVNVPTEVRAVSPLYRVEDLQALIHMLKTAQLTQRKQALDMLVYHYYYYYYHWYYYYYWFYYSSTLQLIVFPSI